MADIPTTSMAPTVKIDDGELQTTIGVMSQTWRRAAAVAINRTLEEVLAGQRQKIQQRFIVRRPSFTLPPQTLPASWRATEQKLWAVVSLGDDTSRGNSSSIGTRRGLILGKFGAAQQMFALRQPIAIPTRALRPNIRDLVPQKKYPRYLVGQFDTKGNYLGLARTARSTVKLKRRKGSANVDVYRRAVGRYFVLGKPGDEIHGLYERTGPKTLRELWVFREAIPIPHRLDFQADAEAVIATRFRPNFDGAFERSLAGSLGSLSSARARGTR